MQLRKKIYLIITFSLFSLWLISTVPVAAYSADSFSQKEGDVFIWKVTISKPLPYLGSTVTVNIVNVGDQIKVEVTLTNQSVFGSILYDTIWGYMYNNSISNQTWELMEPGFQLLGAYNSTYGSPMGYLLFPHNETSVNSSIYMTYNVLFNFQNYQWISGPNGYDGTATSWNGSATGDPNKAKMVLKVNSDGVLEYQEIYNGTGPGWDLVYKMELQPITSPISGFVILPTLCVFSILVAISVLKHKRKPVILV